MVDLKGMSERVETDEPTYTHGGRCLGRWLQVGSTSGEVREKKYRDYPSNFDGGPTQARQKLEPTRLENSQECVLFVFLG